MSLKTNQIARALLAGVCDSSPVVPALRRNFQQTFSFRTLKQRVAKKALIERVRNAPAKVNSIPAAAREHDEQALAGSSCGAGTPKG